MRWKGEQPGGADGVLRVGVPGQVLARVRRRLEQLGRLARTHELDELLQAQLELEVALPSRA